GLEVPYAPMAIRPGRSGSPAPRTNAASASRTQIVKTPILRSNPHAVQSAADMNDRSPFGIRFRLPQDLMRHRRRVAFAEGDVLEEVSERVSLAPTEIDVRHFARRIAQVEEESGDRVRDRRTFRPQDP